MLVSSDEPNRHYPMISYAGNSPHQALFLSVVKE